MAYSTLYWTMCSAFDLYGFRGTNYVNGDCFLELLLTLSAWKEENIFELAKMYFIAHWSLIIPVGYIYKNWSDG